MRGSFGLVSLLVTGLIVAYLWASQTKTVSTVNKTLQPQVRQLAGQNADGTSAKNSATFAPVERGGSLKAIRVITIDPKGGIADYWGLIPNDEILRVGPLGVGEPTMEEFDDVRNWVVEGMQRKMDMSVNRGGTTITLPADRKVAIPAAAGAPAGVNPPAPTGASN